MKPPFEVVKNVMQQQEDELWSLHPRLPLVVLDVMYYEIYIL